MKKLITLIKIIIFIIAFYIIFIAPEVKAEIEGEYFLMTATGYYPGPECTYPFTDGFTAIGDIAGRGSIAIDDKSGPLKMGQQVYIEGYGYGKCNDRGSAIKGWKIDLCFDILEEAKEWGVKLVKVYVIKEVK